jgi:hypothetical protein
LKVNEVALSVYTFIGWLVLAVLWAFPKKLSLAENAVLYYCLNLVVTSILTSLDLNHHYIRSGKAPDLFLAFLIHRTVVIPVVLMLFVNAFFHVSRISSRFGIALAAFALLNGLEWIALRFQVMVYLKWNAMYSALGFLALILLSCLLELCLAHFRVKEAA